MNKIELTDTAAYGGPDWSPRSSSLKEELGRIWSECGVDSEWGILQRVLLHEPAAELHDIDDPAQAQLLARPDPARARRQHRALAQAFESAGVAVEALRPDPAAGPNQMFVADLLWMTPEGAVVARPASTVRAGEERQLAAALARLGIPILHTVHGAATFEGADALWLRPDRVVIGSGFRTNAEGAAQITRFLEGLNVAVETVALPRRSMHLMGCLRFLDAGRALLWPQRAPESLAGVVAGAGYEVLTIPDADEARAGFALNFVTLGPSAILMPAGAPVTAAFLRELGCAVVEVEVDELAKAAGAIGCLSGILKRAPGIR